jgi:hypothetical protein
MNELVVDVDMPEFLKNALVSMERFYRKYLFL